MKHIRRFWRKLCIAPFQSKRRKMFAQPKVYFWDDPRDWQGQFHQLMKNVHKR